jgi:hypothetical protein
MYNSSSHQKPNSKSESFAGHAPGRHSLGVRTLGAAALYVAMSERGGEERDGERGWEGEGGGGRYKIEKRDR